MANSWGASGTTWGQGDWGDQTTTTVVLSGLSITSTLNADGVLSFPESGWGSDTWGTENWGESAVTIVPTGFSITSSLGTLAYAAAEEGWGRDEWGIGNWGQNTTTVIPDGLEMTAGLGPSGWGIAPWEEQVSWGGDLSCQTTQLTIAALTGIEMTGSIGTPTLNYDFIFTLSDSLLLTASRGSLSINNGADHTQGLGGIAMTGSLGTLGHEMTYELTGIEATLSLGTAEATNTELVDLTGIQATGSLGSLTVADMAIGLTGLAITGSVGSFTITDMQIGLSGFEVTGSLGSGGVAPLHYKDVDITGYTAYTDIEHSA